MNTDIVTLNECNNTGSYIHIYYYPIAGAWVSYGISAYLLGYFCKSKGIQTIESYSFELQMPSVIVMDAVDIAKQSSVITNSGSYYLLDSDRKLDNDEYRSWASGLRNNCAKL